MRVIIDDATGAVIGTTTDTAFVAGPGMRVLPAPTDFDASRMSDYRADGDQVTLDLSIALQRAKSTRVAEVKRSAKTAIEALDWRLERAQERERLGVPGESVADVLREREAIRRASNRVEATIQVAVDVESVRAVTFAVTDTDYPDRVSLTPLEFVLRFTAAEREAIMAASANSAALRAMLLELQTASAVVVTDQRTIEAVEGLVAANIIAPTRVPQILSPA